MTFNIANAVFQRHTAVFDQRHTGVLLAGILHGLNTGSGYRPAGATDLR